MIIFALIVLIAVVVTMFIIRHIMLVNKQAEISFQAWKKSIKEPKPKKSQSLEDVISTDGLVELWDSNKKRFRSFIEST